LRVFELEIPVKSRLGPEGIVSILGPCELANEVDGIDQLYDDHNEIDGITGCFMRELNRVDGDDQRENQAEKNRKDHKSDKFWESFVDVAFVPKVESEHLDREPEEQHDHTQHSEN
jgi:hypothetical protein